MQRAKTFCFVCAGMLMLAIAFHFGAISAQGQGVGNEMVDCAWRHSDGYAYAVTKSGEIWANPGYCGAWALVGHMPPGCVPACVLDGDVGGSLDIGCENGDFYTVQGSLPNVSVVLCSSIQGGPTSARSSSWGELKTRYR